MSGVLYCLLIKYEFHYLYTVDHSRSNLNLSNHYLPTHSLHSHHTKTLLPKHSLCFCPCTSLFLLSTGVEELPNILSHFFPSSSRLSSSTSCKCPCDSHLFALLALPYLHSKVISLVALILSYFIFSYWQT